MSNQLPIFSSDSMHIAYTRRLNRRVEQKEQVIIDSPLLPEYDMIPKENVVFRDGTLEFVGIKKGVDYATCYRVTYKPRND